MKVLHSLMVLAVLSFRLYGFKYSNSRIRKNSLKMAFNNFAKSSTSFKEAQVLLENINEIIKSTGIRTSLVRTLQASQAIASVTNNFIQNPDKFKDANNQLSAPKILKNLFERLGATYIKLGQFIASSPTLFPADYVIEFQSCLDKSPTIPYSEIRQIILEELKKPISSLYLEVDPVPIASASIAQVHRAKLRNGTEVVIKVRKPFVAETLKADLGFLYAATTILEFINPSLSRLSLSNIVGDIRESMLEELDFTKEADNLIKFRSFLSNKGLLDATAPLPYLFASGKRVLTMEYLEGIPLTDLEGIKGFSANPEKTLISALNTWATSVVENDFFHADVHAGNLLVLKDGRIGFIDFGIVGRISEKVWNGLNDLLQSFITEDYTGIAKALVSIGATESSIDIESFGKELKEVVEKITKIQTNVVVEASSSGELIGANISIDERETTEIVLQIVSVADKNGLKLPREFGLLLKQALYFDRYQKLLAPTLDPLRDTRVRSSLSENDFRRNSINNKKESSTIVIDTEIIEK